MSGVLYLVPTPIGNLNDMSARAIDILSEVDFIAAEDTRVTIKLLNHLNIKKPMVSYYRHNTGVSGTQIIQRLIAGENCALVTDAGTPAISDPGEELVAMCVEQNIIVVGIPGPCALVTAIAVSGLPTGRFTFEGFLAMNKKNRKAHLESLKNEQRTMIFYEAPHKLISTLNDMCDYFGSDRRIALCRELTKMHEEIKRTTLGEALAWYRDNNPKGEFVLVIEGCTPEIKAELTIEEAVERVKALYSEGTPMKLAAKQIAQETGFQKNELYRLAIQESIKISGDDTDE